MTAKKEEKKVAPKKKVATKKRVAKKVAPKKKVATKKRVAKKVATKNNVEMISYAIKMVIPTGDYANIQPEIIVKAASPEEAHAFMAPHMNKLWKDYFMISKRKVTPEVKKPVTPAPAPAPAPVTPAPAPAPVTPAPVTPAPTVGDDLNNQPTVTAQVEASPVSSVAMTRATQAIQSCLSMDALNLIIQQVKVSVKLTEQDKIDLTGIIMEKQNELNIAEFDKME